MQVINEKRDSKGSIYFERVYKNDKNKVIGKEEIRFPTFTCEQQDGFKAIIIYANDMQPIPEAFSFLNQKNEPYATRRQAAPALRLLYSYETITSKKIDEFTVADIESLKDFLSGLSYSGSNLQFNLIETRDNATVNTYLGIYRKYCDHNGIKNTALNQKYFRPPHMITGTVSDGNTLYRANKKVAQQQEVPMYISPEEFERIIKLIRSEYTLREEIIVRLMYENGLRIGEVLGLTNDDLVEENVKDIGWVNVLYLRNRLSDDEVSQSAKGRMRVRAQKDYIRKEYNLIGYGYHKVPISHSLTEQIGVYLEKIHLDAREKYGNAYWGHVAADRVRESEKFEDPNFYIFLNTKGGRLTQSTWNITLRQIFHSAGLEVDTEKKKHNLNHRFRHGFAMRLVKAGMGRLELQKQMRHASIDSVACYYRPTISDIIRTKTLFENEIAMDILELSDLTNEEE